MNESKASVLITQHDSTLQYSPRQSQESLKEQLQRSLIIQKQQMVEICEKNPDYVIKQAINDQKMNILIQNKTRELLVAKLDGSELKKLKLKNKDQESPLHSVFRWMLLVFYKSDPQHYCWLNFKKQVFDKDNGRDLLNRLALMNVGHLYKWDADRTDYVLSLRPQIMMHFRGNQKLTAQFEILFDIIQLVKKTCLCFFRLQELYEELEKERTKARQMNDQIKDLRKSIVVIKERLKTIEF